MNRLAYVPPGIADREPLIYGTDIDDPYPWLVDMLSDPSGIDQ
jgi:hypothetical protein